MLQVLLVVHSRHVQVLVDLLSHLLQFRRFLLCLILSLCLGSQRLPQLVLRLAELPKLRRELLSRFLHKIKYSINYSVMNLP